MNKTKVNMLLDLDDIIILPSSTMSKITSRKEIELDETLPIFTAPMDTVVDESNYEHFLNNKINIVFPRGIINNNGFQSYGIEDFKEKFTKRYEGLNKKILIDVANGHMEEITNSVKVAKEINPELIIMGGNIAHPNIIHYYEDAGIDYVRLSIGSGSGCLTSVNTAIGYPIASLISECYKIKSQNNYKIKLIADGGMRKYSDIIKALALGADYVMIGGLFNKMIESCGDTYMSYLSNKVNLDNKIENNVLETYNIYKHSHKFYKYFRGMSTKAVQKEWGRTELKTAEGIEKYNEVTGSLYGWTENFIDYLKSTISYCGHKSLQDFIGNVEVEMISQNAYKRFNK
jgi:IMP dehydrogenase/GMP reductase